METYDALEESSSVNDSVSIAENPLEEFEAEVEDKCHQGKSADAVEDLDNITAKKSHETKCADKRKDKTPPRSVL